MYFTMKRAIDSLKICCPNSSKGRGVTRSLHWVNAINISRNALHGHTKLILRFTDFPGHIFAECKKINQLVVQVRSQNSHVI